MRITKITPLYERLSRDYELQGESNRIINQKQMLEDYARRNKMKEICLNTYQDSREAQQTISEYIESWYNRKRTHSAIDYMTPEQKKDMEIKKVA